jgi:peptidoglycan hydrolase-like protein with peptidoglycan-binding domain
MARYACVIVAVLAALALSLPATALGQGQQMGQGRGAAVAPGVQCNKQCVMDVQRKLQSEGMYQGKIDGIAGRGTRKAVREFQSKEGLPPTGKIDQQVLSSLKLQPAQQQPGQGRGQQAPWEHPVLRTPQQQQQQGQ